MSAKDEVDRLLRDHGATLLRSKNHQVWKLPSGHNFVIPQTPSDCRAWANALQILRDLLGIKVEARKNPGRRRKKGVGKPLYKAEPLVARRNNPLEGWTFPETRRMYNECFPVAIERVPMTPVWFWMRRVFGYGGKR